MTNGLKPVLDDLNDMKNGGYTTGQAVEILKLLELRRIADELADIELCLTILNSHADELTDCISKTRGGSFLSITGNVTNYV